MLALPITNIFITVIVVFKNIMSTALCRNILEILTKRNVINLNTLRNFSRRSVNAEGPFIVKSQKPQEEKKGNIQNKSASL